LMAGAWESTPTVLTAILHTEIVPMAWALGFRNLKLPGPVMPITAMPFDHARNVACMAAIEHGADFIMMLDSDVIPPNDAVLRLLAHDLPVVSGVYCRRSPPHGIPVMQRNHNWVVDIPDAGLIEVDVVGAGCLLIRRDVLTDLPPVSPERGKAWFDWRVDAQSLYPPGEAMSEDFTWCNHIRKFGIKIMVDCSIRCRHIGWAEAGYKSYVPCNSTPNT